MKKVTDYIEVGELCEAPDGSVLKCVKEKGTMPCSLCAISSEAGICHKIHCLSSERADKKDVHFEKLD